MLKKKKQSSSALIGGDVCSVSVLTGMIFHIGLKGRVPSREVLKFLCMICCISLFASIIFLFLCLTFCVPIPNLGSSYCFILFNWDHEGPRLPISQNIWFGNTELVLLAKSCSVLKQSSEVQAVLALGFQPEQG